MFRQILAGSRYLILIAVIGSFLASISVLVYGGLTVVSIILQVLVTPSEVMDNQPMRDLIFRTRFRWKLRPRSVTGDTKYGTLENIRALEDAGIRAYVPLPDWEHMTPYFGPSKFTYDAAQDVYVCPQGQLLRPFRTEQKAEKVEYRADAATCNACPLKAQCTDSQRGRQLHRSFHANYLERVKGYHHTPAYQKTMNKRKVWVEPLFAEAKDWHGMRRFRLRLLWRVNCEALRIAAGQNLKRLLKKRGWGRRPFPIEALCAFFFVLCGWFTCPSVVPVPVSSWIGSPSRINKSEPILSY
jgi:hypothetical protein